MWHLTLFPLWITLAALQGPESSHGPKLVSTSEDSTVASIIQGFRTHGGNVTLAIDFLTEKYGPVPLQQRDALADSLVVLAIEYEPGVSPLEMDVSSGRATHVLVEAGATSEGSRYSGAFDRLVEIHKQGKDIGLRGRALHGMAKQPDTTATLAYLREVIVSTDRSAFIAVEVLASETGPAGVALAFQIYCEKSAPTYGAQRYLRSFASNLKWKCS